MLTLLRVRLPVCWEQPSLVISCGLCGTVFPSVHYSWFRVASWALLAYRIGLLSTDPVRLRRSTNVGQRTSLLAIDCLRVSAVVFHSNGMWMAEWEHGRTLTTTQIPRKINHSESSFCTVWAIHRIYCSPCHLVGWIINCANRQWAGLNVW